MAQEDKELLLKDLCVRLPYGVKVQVIQVPIGLSKDETLTYNRMYSLDESDEYITIKPYLRPMSSMTEEELHEVQGILGKGVEIREDFIISVDSSMNSFTYLELIAIFDWFNKNHFDYRGLIPMSLAIAVTEENNPYKD